MTSLQTQIEAHAFRALLAHMRARNDVQNIDLMNLAGFCRNCCAKWTLLGARTVGYPMTYDEACEYVYGEPYGDWKKKHQVKASAEQLAAFESGRRLHAKHDALEALEATPRDAVGATRAPFVSVSGALSEVCCTPAEELSSGSGDAVAAACALRDGAAARSVRVGVLTCSDRAAAGTYADESGPLVERAVCEYAAASGALVIAETSRVVVADDVDDIEAALRDLTSRCDLVLTTGGTGCAPRDVTPEATARVLAREIPGIPEAIRAVTSIAEPRAALSRAVAGVAVAGALVVNLPGAPHAAKQCLGVCLPLFPRVLDTLAERR